MYSIKLTCKTITPIFMAGADGRTPELRTSEFKGMMRFWWRAIKSENNITKLRREESEIFGGSGEGEGKSKVSIKVYPQPQKENIRNSLMKDINSYDGIKYLLYSTILPNRERSYIEPDFQFYIELHSTDENAFKQALDSLWAAIYLGGFGTRSRRGGGNIEIIKSEGNSNELSFILSNISSTNNLKQEIEKNINKIFCFFGRNRQNTNYPNMSNFRIIILNPENTWQEALNTVGDKFKKYRIENKSKIFDMGAFGMPIMHSRFTMRIVPYMKDKRISERMASPIIIKVIKANNRYFPILIKLSTYFPYIGKEIKNDRVWIKSNDIKNINDFKINEFLNNINNKEEIIL